MHAMRSERVSCNPSRSGTFVFHTDMDNHMCSALQCVRLEVHEWNARIAKFGGGVAGWLGVQLESTRVASLPIRSA